MNNQRLPNKLLINRWDSVKCRGHPRKSWLAQVDSLVKDLDLQDKNLAVKIIKEAIDKRECGQFGTALWHKELKGEIEFEEYFKYVKRAPSSFF